MQAVVWHGKRDVRVARAPDPIVKEPTDVIVRITSGEIRGSDLDRVVPFNVSCGTRFIRGQRQRSQCQTTQVLVLGMGVSQFGSTKLHGLVPGGQAACRMPLAEAPSAHQTSEKKPDCTSKVLLRP